MVNKLGFAVQLCTLRWQGYFLGDTRGLPATVLETLARQLGLLAMSIEITRRTRRPAGNTWSVSASTCVFQQCDDFQRQRLLKHLTETAQAVPRSDALRQEAWRWCRSSGSCARAVRSPALPRHLGAGYSQMKLCLSLRCRTR